MYSDIAFLPVRGPPLGPLSLPTRTACPDRQPAPRSSRAGPTRGPRRLPVAQYCAPMTEPAAETADDDGAVFAEVRKLELFEGLADEQLHELVSAGTFARF